MTGYLARCKVRLNAEAEMPLNLDIEIEQENDGRWMAEIPAIPGLWSMVSLGWRGRAVCASLAPDVLADRFGQDTDGLRPQDL